MTFEREDALRRTETSKSTMRRHVRRHSAAVNTHVRTGVRPTSVDRPTREHYRRKRAVSATVDREINLHCQQLAVFRHRGLDMRTRRVSLRCCDHVFRAIVNDLDRLARLPRQQRSMSGDERRILFLAAETTAGFR